MEQKTDTAPNINGYSESRPLCICIQFGGMSGEQVRRRAEHDCAPLHCTLSSLFVLAVWLWMNGFRSLTAHRLSASCENLSEQQQLIKALMRTCTRRFIINLWLLGTGFSGRWNVTVQLCAIPAKNKILQKLNIDFNIHYCQLNCWNT